VTLSSSLLLFLCLRSHDALASVFIVSERTNQTTRGLMILVARVTVRYCTSIFPLCHYFARRKIRSNTNPCASDRSSAANHTLKSVISAMLYVMAGIRGRSGPPGNHNAFRHGLAGIAQRRADGVLNSTEQLIREEILSGLLADKGRAAQISKPCGCWRRSSPATCLCWSRSITQSTASFGTILKPRANPKALAQLDG